MNWPHAIFVGPVIVMIGFAVCAAELVFAVLIHRETSFIAFTDSCVRRLAESRLAPCLWGLAELIAILFVGVSLIKIHGLGLLGALILILGLLLFGAAIGVAGLAVGRQCTQDDESIGFARQTRTGLFILVFASAVPIVGWLVTTIIGLAALGAATEVLVTGKK